MTSRRRFSSSMTTIVKQPTLAISLKNMLHSPPPPIVQFKHFSELPAEIRLLIWRFALPGPRIVLLEPQLKSSSLRFCYRVRSDAPISHPNQFFNGTLDGISFPELRKLVEAGDIGPVERGNDVFFRSCCPSPGILGVCVEARQEAMRFYERAFGTTTRGPGVWFDYEVDELFLDWGDGRVMLDYRPECFAVRDLAKMRNLVLYERASRLESEGYGGVEAWVAEVLEAFTGVRRVTRSVFGGDCTHGGEAVVLKDLVPVEIQEYWLRNKVNPTEEDDFFEALSGGVLESVPLDLGKLKREMNVLAEMKYLRSGKGAARVAKSIPEIEYKIAMSSGFKTQLDIGERLYWDGVKRGDIIHVVSETI